jgi:hypothetical protein
MQGDPCLCGGIPLFVAMGVVVVVALSVCVVRRWSSTLILRVEEDHPSPGLVVLSGSGVVRDRWFLVYGQGCGGVGVGWSSAVGGSGGCPVLSGGGSEILPRFCLASGTGSRLGWGHD